MLKRIYKKFRRIVFAVLRHSPRLRWWVRSTYWGFRRKQYAALYRGIAVEQKSILFESFSGRSYSCSPRAIFEALCEDTRFDSWQFFWSFNNNHIADIPKDHPLLTDRAKPIERGTSQYFMACAKSAFWVLNSRMPEWINPKSDQKYIQCWHGTPLKRLGFDMPQTAVAALNTTKELSKRYQIDAQKWTYLLSPSAYCSEHLLTAFGVPPETNCTVLEVGYPRNDAIVNIIKSSDPTKVIKDMKQQLKIPDNKHILLYAPTWRDSKYDKNYGYMMDNELDFDLLQKSLGKEWIILLRAHYYIRNRIELDHWNDFIIDVSNANDINDLYVVSDALMTDYSSALFDYSNTGRPIILFFPDYEFYKNEQHGFYMDPFELPGYKCFTSEEVVAAIESLDNWDDQFGEEYKVFHQHFCPMDDGLATERVIEQVFIR